LGDEVGVVPKRKEILIPGLGFIRIALHGVGAGEAEMGECPDRSVDYKMRITARSNLSVAARLLNSS
jgi:hypothetical protein